MSEVDLNLIEADAKKYAELSFEEVYEIVLREWYKSGGSKDQIVVRGGKDFLLKVIKRLAMKLVENRATVSSAFGLAVGEAVNWAKTKDLDLTTYRVFISVMAAAIANSVIDEIENRTSV